MKLAETSSWELDVIHDFLSNSLIPIRIAVADGEFPLVCSIWFFWDPDHQAILCATHEKSYLAKCLKREGKCGFEIAADQPPYMGVRGKANVALEREGAGELLERLTDRYLDEDNQSLGKWLLKRKDEEYLIRIEPEWLTSWDYSGRMTK